MAETINTIPEKGLWSLKISDFLKGAFYAILPQIIAVLDFWNSSDHWPTWTEWLPYLKITVYTFVVYLLKNFSTNNAGQLFTPDKPVVLVPTQKLADLQQQADAPKN